MSLKSTHLLQRELGERSHPAQSAEVAWLGRNSALLCVKGVSLLRSMSAMTFLSLQ